MENGKKNCKWNTKESLFRFILKYKTPITNLVLKSI